jgi:aminocarboxymuconate-semialdehyde decarboxylase
MGSSRGNHSRPTTRGHLRRWRGVTTQRTAAETFRGLYWDTALAVGDPVLRMLRSVVGLDHVVCGSDYPYFRHDLAVGCIASLMDTEELAVGEREAVMNANAVKLFPRFADRSARPFGRRPEDQPDAS